MLSDITLGQFFPGKSLLHRLDPRTKVILSVLYMVAVFAAKHVFLYAWMIAVTVLMIALSGISGKVILKSLKPLLFIFLFTSILNVFFTTGEGEPLLSFWRIRIYTEGLWRALLMVVRVSLLVTGVSVLLTYTTSPIALTDAIERLLAPLKLIKVPVHDFAMMMSIALRFIPTLVEETEKIMNAQKARGADFTSGGLLRRAKALIPILIPLFISSFNHANDLAIAMECRCYRGGQGRTKMTELRYGGRDYLAMVLCAGLLAAVLVGNGFFLRLGVGYYMP
ncbi:MAG: energy-coupling factor transporter transmembrane component T [Eubacteriales bacterium]